MCLCERFSYPQGQWSDLQYSVLQVNSLLFKLPIWIFLYIDTTFQGGSIYMLSITITYFSF